jgi:tetratricopeptide (TPR) repeat protein
LNQAVMADPQRGPAHLLLGQVYASHQRHDLELRELRAYADWLESREELSSRELEQVTLIDQRIDELEQLISKVDEQMSGPDFAELRPSQRAFYYNQAGCLLAAQRLLESDMETVNRFPPALLLRLLLQLETGQVEEAYLESERLSGLFAQGGDDRWRDIHAFSKLANAEHLQAVESWNTYADNVLMQSTMKLMYEFSPRFTTENPEADWPVTQLQASSTALFEAMTTATNFRVSAGLVQMEAGYVKEAVETFERVLRDNPETTERGIVGYYLARLTGKSIDVFPPSEMLPILFGDDPEEIPADEAPAGKTDPQNP